VPPHSLTAGAGAAAALCADERDRGDRDRHPDERWRGPPPSTNKLVGGDLAYHAARGVATLLGDAVPPPGAHADAITVLLARRTRSELYDYLDRMKAMAQRNPDAARQLLTQHPQLAKALFQVGICACVRVCGVGGGLSTGLSCNFLCVRAISTRHYITLYLFGRACSAAI
jgi:hypothetical protein